MNRELELLDRFYYSFINLDNPKDFFNGMADYAEFIDSVPEFEKISTELLNEREPFIKRRIETDRIAVEKMKEVHKELLTYITDNKIEKEGIKQALKEYDAWLNGEANGSQDLCDNLHDLLCDIIRYLYESGTPEDKEFVRHYIIFWSNQTAIKHWLYPKEIEDYFEALKDFDEKRETELWGQVGQVSRLYGIIKNGRDKRKELVKSSIENKSGKAIYELFFNHDILLGEWIHIEGGKSGGIVFFDIQKIRPIITRLQNYILRKINEKANERANVFQDLKEMENKWLGLENISQKNFTAGQTEMGETLNRQREQNLEDKRHRETLKQNRILATKENKYLHAIDTIIERADLGDENFSIDYYYFNFEDRMDASKILEKFLSELAGAGCFEKYARANYAEGVRFGFIKANAAKLREFREKLNETYNGTGKKRLEISSNKGEEEIKKIILIELRSGKHLIAVNDDYSKVKKIRKSKYYPIFIEEVSKREVLNRTDNVKVSDEMAEYFNTNKKCIIYMNGKYALKAIFTGNEDEREINWEVKTEIIDEDIYLKRLKKTTNK